MTDKDLLERSVIKDTFSEEVIICIFHSMRTFSREITCEKMGISQADRNKSLEILQKMVYAKTEGEFEQFHNLLNISAPKRVIEYFDKNWYPIKDEWSMSKNLMKGCFQNTTNNRIESINAKLKSVITKVRAFVFHHYIIP
jgi:zinc finger SWIM domain-containing protein 3